MCSRFITGMCYQLLENDEPCLMASGFAQMFQYRETILVLPVVKHSARKEDRNTLLLRRLRVKEVVALGTRRELTAEGRWMIEVKIDEARIFTRPDSSDSGMFFFQNCISSEICDTWMGQWIRCMYLYCISDNRLTVLDNKPEMWPVGSKRQ